MPNFSIAAMSQITDQLVGKICFNFKAKYENRTRG